MSNSAGPDLPPPETETQDNQTIDNQTLEKNETGNSKEVEKQEEKANVGEDDEETECGFCLFMKSGGCREQFIAWEKCVEGAEKNKEDIVDKCYEVTRLLKECMDQHSDYYEPILSAEKAMEEQASIESDNQEAAPEAAK